MNTLMFLFVVLISCILQGITGFGFAVLAAPLSLLFLDQQTVVVVLTVISLVLNSYLILKIKAHTNIHLIYHLLFLGLVGVPIGVIALFTINSDTLKLIVGAMSVAFAFALFFVHRKLKQNDILTNTTGLLTGFLQSSIGLSGPPVALLLTSYGVKTPEMRKTMAIFFLGLSLFTLPIFIYRNIVTPDRLLTALISIPFVLIGGQIGSKISDRVPKRIFRIASLILVSAVGVQLMYNVLSK